MEITSVIIKPKITEKTQNMRNLPDPKMAFYVNPKSNKNQISNAFRSLFGVEPSSINIVNGKPSPARMTNRSRKNYKKSFKIAYITISSADFHGFQSKLDGSQGVEENSPEAPAAESREGNE